MQAFWPPLARQNTESGSSACTTERNSVVARTDCFYREGSTEAPFACRIKQHIDRAARVWRYGRPTGIGGLGELIWGADGDARDRKRSTAAIGNGHRLRRTLSAVRPVTKSQASRRYRWHDATAAQLYAVSAGGGCFDGQYASNRAGCSRLEHNIDRTARVGRNGGTTVTGLRELG